jgi:energy-coupling factor transport system substrate-specific component
MAWVLIPIGIGINMVGSFFVNVLRLPIYLDSIGTFLVAILAGPFVAVVAGVATNIIKGIAISPTSAPFAITQAGLALTAGYLARRGWFRISETREYGRLLGSGLILAAVSTIISTPIIVLVFGGVKGDPQDAVVAFFLATGSSLVEAVLSEQIIISPTDKVLSIVVAYLLAANVPERYLPEQGLEALSTRQQGSGSGSGA